ncbi:MULTISPECIES: hypothetical protein [unclassified Ensifer]|uniref:hypothetical protein n=1 Tax=unclassified Ensifer TaxID=2633371 RepID=UPI000813249C|nr:MULTISPECIES: hypothetical protein [unclassified Ensifer]OCO98664.1 hypothetical protein BC362_28270 [Ensifer sp. LC14]OCP13144.1 hypothetical protein BC374_12885 [Ensifer sp. LC13]OCP13748.1 hypothetical protein BBX50_13165 [Ensifer sp. LC11]OCP28124.1 hypothetical protein BC364_11285 [Ensifer sp. LC499]
MSSLSTTAVVAPLYRINKYTVPVEARQQFVELVDKTLAVIRKQDGYVKDLFLEQHAGPGQFDFITMIEFTNADVAPKVAAALIEFDRELGLDRAALMNTLGIRTDFASYRAFGGLAA